ncbi:MAG: sigma 54-interacting transcriptional regulator [Proteobacteria bacterium]|nr:sigma 54-interacting transcriptional regulator [Pseudomonadota bacterium]MBU4009204.1 sigma 54-interacting transcriptional regulator [Pseudomonadota bacterium]
MHKDQLIKLLNQPDTQEELLKLIHELQLRQIELDIQIEKLRKTNEELGNRYKKYSDLYEFAPVGYLTLDEKGNILKFNSASSKLLGVERSKLTGIPFCRLVAEESIPLFKQFIQTVFSKQANASCELKIKVQGKKRIYLHIEGTSKIPGLKLKNRCLAVIGDSTAYIEANNALNEYMQKLNKRVKELDCHYKLSSLKSNSLAELLQKTAEILPPAWQHSDKACARIILDGQSYKTRNFQETIWRQASNIIINGRPAGTVEVGYLEQIAQSSEEDPFLFEERNLLDVIATRISKIIERVRAKEALSNAFKASQLREREIAALFNSSRAILKNQSFPDAARAIFDACKELIGASSGYVALLSIDGIENEVLFLDSGGLPCNVDSKLPMPIRGLRAEAYRTGKTVYENNFSNSSWIQFIPKGHVRLNNVLFSPLAIGGKVVGIMGIANKSGGFTEDDSRMATSFGELASIALMNSMSIETIKELNRNLELRVEERTAELQTSNKYLEQEIEEHREADKALRKALSEIKKLKDQIEAENIYLRKEVKTQHQFADIIGNSDSMKHAIYLSEQVSNTNTTVLIQGETGTGKELFAAAIHNLSPRKDRPMITVNCAALPSNLIESELFGREKGAFTGADSLQVGRFEIANNSTLCLDEIGELPLEIQAKLLRAIQYSKFERLGSSKTIKVDVRILATTNRNLEEEVRNGRFRQDLFYRLNVFPITVPPLRRRKEDIPLLVGAFVSKFARKSGKKIDSIPKETMRILQDYSWPGNVRELESVIERSVILCPETTLYLADKLEPVPLPLSSGISTLEEIERMHILRSLSLTGWRINGKNGTASLLGIHPSTLRARMHKLKIKRPEY